jgi:hypothetical protein
VVDLAGLEMGPFANGGTGGLPPPSFRLFWNNISSCFTPAAGIFLKENIHA